ncbi:MULTISPECIES: glycosyltransferase [Methanothermobacter]|uniref:Glycosyltransferase n=1 Tax=Methanothermobacter wolfeii TaxID=145261 RepID=A0A9E7RT25_METWO|nr:glycosyltransferase [Methanothermobacter wolfeii]UXH31683.1 glycosyltransferase [Methanothermobacter wolfeii]
MSWLILIMVFLLCALKRGITDNLSVSVVIPAFNEEKTVAEVVEAARNSDMVTEVIVVDDGSTDSTAEVAENAGAKVIRHTSNRGKGAALRTGFKHSKGEIVAFVDADLKNMTTEKLEKMIKPILRGKADLTKTRFRRKAGRVTELTAKPLLNFFFPEIKFEQPLSGQFAARRSVLEKMKFEEDYGVDVGIVLDADVMGLTVREVDIGTIKHDMASLSDLNLVANEVVRTIVDRALAYGRITMMDSMGKAIRMCILGLSLTTLGVFSIFFIRAIPAMEGVVIAVAGLIVAVYYLLSLIRRSVYVFRRSTGKVQAVRSFIYMHFPILVSGLILIAMISTLLGAVHVDDGKISIEPTSGNLIIWKKSQDNRTFDVRGPYTVDSALENENGTIRIPEEAIKTLGLNYGDRLFIANETYTLNRTRQGEGNIMRMPLDAREALQLNAGDVIQDGNLRKVFNGIYAMRNISESNITVLNGVIIQTDEAPGRQVRVLVDGVKVAETSGVMKKGAYTIYINGVPVRRIMFSDEAANYTVYWGRHVVKVEVLGTLPSDMLFASSSEGRFLNIWL